MVSVIAPPGCYGTYISRCLYHYTDLGFIPGWSMTFDSTGSSHDFRQIKQNAASGVCNMHQDRWSEISFDQKQIVIAYADSAHQLDYYNNQFTKQTGSDLTQHLLMHLSKQEITHKLLEQWHYNGPLHLVPRWIMREFLSFWLDHSWQDGYNVEKYVSIPHAVAFCCEDLSDTNWQLLLTQICNILDLELLETADNIQHNHDNFMRCQIFHGIQNRCEQFVEACISNTKLISNPCITIFDEAFIQCKLRDLGWEIKCDGLDIFPSDSMELYRIIDKK